MGCIIVYCSFYHQLTFETALCFIGITNFLLYMFFLSLVLVVSNSISNLWRLGPCSCTYVNNSCYFMHNLSVGVSVHESIIFNSWSWRAKRYFFALHLGLLRVLCWKGQQHFHYREFRNDKRFVFQFTEGKISLLGAQLIRTFCALELVVLI
jgi:hypothetical protein